MPEIDTGALSDQALVDFVNEQRWYGSKSREIVDADVIDVVPLPTLDPRRSIALVEVRFQPGTHDTYQLLLGMRPSSERWPGADIDDLDGWTIYEGFNDPELGVALLDLMRGGATLRGHQGTIDFRQVAKFPEPDGAWEALAADTEQSNSSILFGESMILKVYRRLEAGVNPELELLRFLTVQGFENIATLRGWYEYAGRPLDATLGILQDYIQSRNDGWHLALDAFASDPGAFLAQVRRLGEVTGAMHTVLASDPSDPNFAPEEASLESLSLLVASVDEEVERVFLDLPEGVEALAPIAGRGEEIRDQLHLLSRAGSLGRLIRHHGDYHLGQVLWTGADWVVVDFEGEPARSLAERRQKRSPLRDVAGMLRSFAYVASAGPLLREVDVPANFEERAREDFLAGYLAEVDPSLLPPGDQAVERLLAVFELEKAVYELRYELDNRPDWVGIPVAGIERLLGAGVK